MDDIIFAARIFFEEIFRIRHFSRGLPQKAAKRRLAAVPCSCFWWDPTVPRTECLRQTAAALRHITATPPLRHTADLPHRRAATPPNCRGFEPPPPVASLHSRHRAVKPSRCRTSYRYTADCNATSSNGGTAVPPAAVPRHHIPCRAPPAAHQRSPNHGSHAMAEAVLRPFRSQAALWGANTPLAATSFHAAAGGFVAWDPLREGFDREQNPLFANGFARFSLGKAAFHRFPADFGAQRAGRTLISVKCARSAL